MSTSSVVSLQCNCLYVATQTIPVVDGGGTIRPNLWHWCFFITDARGHAEQHHWTIGGVDQNGEHTELYQHREIGQVSAVTQFSHYVVFAKIGGWVHPGANILYATLDALYKRYEGISSTQLRNRPGGRRSCRTWIFHALFQFVVNEWLVPFEFDSHDVIRQWLQVAVQDVILRKSYTVTAALLAPSSSMRTVFRPAMLEMPASS